MSLKAEKSKISKILPQGREYLYLHLWKRQVKMWRILPQNSLKTNLLKYALYAVRETTAVTDSLRQAFWQINAKQPSFWQTVSPIPCLRQTISIYSPTPSSCMTLQTIMRKHRKLSELPVKLFQYTPPLRHHA